MTKESYIMPAQGCTEADVRTPAESSGLDALLIVPPFSPPNSPSLAAHLLQAAGRDAGFAISVLYADQIFMRIVGQEFYERICNTLMSPYLQVGERIFCSTAFGYPLLGKNAERCRSSRVRNCNCGHHTDWLELQGASSKVEQWLEDVSEIVIRRNPAIIGLTTSHQQTCASVALINRVKRSNGRIVAVIGGANCTEQMSDGILSLSDQIDYVFEGEAELTWVDFLRQFRRGLRPANRVVRGRKCLKLDHLPIPNYYDYVNQTTANNVSLDDVWLVFETSRGCWWAEKTKCTFCGLNGTYSSYRTKSAASVIEELRQTLGLFPSKKVCMADAVMPKQYFRELLPQIPALLPNITIFYEQRAALDLREILLLRDAGVRFMQVGIESLSTPQLRRLHKGTTAKQNVCFLRYARSAGCVVGWNMLTEIPSDKDSEWEGILEMLPLLHHLSPPSMLRPVEVARFSPYFESPGKYGLRNLQPMEVYYDIFPPSARITDLAWLFTAEYDCSSRRNRFLTDAVEGEIELWISRWRAGMTNVPTLEVHRIDNERFLLLDTREMPNTRSMQCINRKQACAALLGARGSSDALTGWLRDSKLAVELDGELVPLATACPELFLEFHDTSACEG